MSNFSAWSANDYSSQNGQAIDVRVLVSFDLVVTRDWVGYATDGKTPTLLADYEPFLGFLICYDPATKSVIPVFKNIRPQCFSKFTVLATDDCGRDTSFIDHTKLLTLKGHDPHSDANNPTEVEGKLAHLRCMEQHCPKRYYPGEHVKVYESYESAFPLRISLTPRQQAYLGNVVNAAIKGNYKSHILYKYPPYNKYDAKETLGYLIDLDKDKSFYPNAGGNSIDLPSTEKTGGKTNFITGSKRSFIKDLGDKVQTKLIKEKILDPITGIETISNSQILEFKHFILDNGEEEESVENQSSCSSCIDINYAPGCINGAQSLSPIFNWCPENDLHRKCFYHEDASTGNEKYLKIFTREYLSCWKVGEKIHLIGEDKYKSGKEKTVKSEVSHVGTDRWARNWILIKRWESDRLNLQAGFKLVHACFQLYDVEEREICFCDCTGFSRKMKVLVTEDTSSLLPCTGSGSSVGICCKNGQCSEVTRAFCEQSGGTWVPDKHCNDATPPCSADLGICCVGSVCSETTQVACDNVFGIWVPTPNPDCNTLPCATAIKIKVANSGGSCFPSQTVANPIIGEAVGTDGGPGSLIVVVYGTTVNGPNQPLSNEVPFGSLGYLASKEKTILLNGPYTWNQVTHATAYSTFDCVGNLHRQFDIQTVTNVVGMVQEFSFFISVHN